MYCTPKHSGRLESTRSLMVLMVVKPAVLVTCSTNVTVAPSGTAPLGVYVQSYSEDTSEYAMSGMPLMTNWPTTANSPDSGSIGLMCNHKVIP